jgi:hypothetical protein
MLQVGNCCGWLTGSQFNPVKTGLYLYKNRSKPVAPVPVAVFENVQMWTTGFGSGFPNLDKKPDLTGL